MRIYSRGKYWWCSGTDSTGRRWWRSTKVPVEDPGRIPTRARKAAKRIAGEEFLRGERPPALELVEVLGILAEHKKRKGNAPETLQILRDKGRRLLDHFGPQFDCASLTIRDYEGYMDARLAVTKPKSISRHTIWKELKTLSSGLRQARRRGLYHGDPAALWPDSLHDVYTPRERWLPKEEFAALLSAAPEHRRDYLITYTYLGLSFSELYKIEAFDLKAEDRSVHVRGTKRKTRDRIIPCTSPVWEVLTRRARLHPEGRLFPQFWGRANVSRDLKVWARHARIEPLCTNDLRRTFCSWLCQAEVPELTTARLMGHSSSRMVRNVYGRLSPATLRGAVDKLPELG